VLRAIDVLGRRPHPRDLRRMSPCGWPRGPETIMATSTMPRTSRNLQWIAAGLALGIATAALVAMEYVDARRDVVATLDTQARNLSDASVEALIFGNADQAKRRLEAISAQPLIGAATLYRYDLPAAGGARILASVRASPQTSTLTGLFGYTHVTTVMHQGVPLGEVHLESDPGVIFARLARYALTLLLVGLAAFALAHALTGGMRRRAVAAEQKLLQRAHFDELTGLSNRGHFMDHIATVTRDARRTNSRFALLFCDLDRFKEINDRLGHEVGDRLLAIVGARLRGAVRDQDTVSRLGGDEFVALAAHCDGDGARRVAAHIIERLSEPYSVDQHRLSVGVSIGIALFPDDGESAGELLRAADTAVYAAKTSGRGRYCFFSSELETVAQERKSIEHCLRRALSAGQLSVCYQAKVDAGTRQVCGAEALLRWSSPELGEVPPARFIPIAEQSELIGEIGAWVLNEACREAARWMRHMPGFTIAVNLSARQLRDPAFAQRVGECLARHGVPADRLELEITESALLGFCDEARATVRHLAQSGVTLSLDDFGSGWSSLAHLRELPISRVKIDSNFVRELPGNGADDCVVRAIVALAGAFDLRVVAEGVETEDQFCHLCAAGCNDAQGWLFGRELSASEFAARHLDLH
jgi:diguanylate cyclase (GGDEF)-like protein